MAKLKTHEQYENELFEREIDAYPLEPYAGSKQPILHICGNGHERVIAPERLLAGRGCPICKGKNKRSDDAYKDLLLDLGIDVTPLEAYVNNKTPILHRCSVGHEWHIRPHDLTINGQGCPQCANAKRPGGYNNTRFSRDRELAESPGLLYVIVLVNKSTMERECVKIGITKGVSNKDILKRAKGFTGYEPRIQKEVKGTLEQVFNLEQQLHQQWQEFRYFDSHKFAGHTELFQIDKLPEILKSIPAKV